MQFSPSFCYYPLLVTRDTKSKKPDLIYIKMSKGLLRDRQLAQLEINSNGADSAQKGCYVSITPLRKNKFHAKRMYGRVLFEHSYV
jgi:hypothetical protein